MSGLNKEIGEFLNTKDQKQVLRNYFGGLRKRILKSQRAESSKKILNHLYSDKRFTSSGSVLVYCSKSDEVDTSQLIATLIKDGRKVLVPYCGKQSRKIGVAEIADIEKDLTIGKYGIAEPVEQLRDNCSKNEIGCVICPGVAFDRRGVRLGRGGGYYDTFLSEIKSNVPIIGLAFDCQISAEPLPFDNHDIRVDEVITQSGPRVVG